MSRADDFDKVGHLIEALAQSPQRVQMLVIDGAPASKSRPRFGKGGRVYTPSESRAAEKRTGYELRRAFPEPIAGNVALACVFYRPNRQRIDADNMLKHICDAANRIVWHDDSQVTAITGIVEMDAASPRTVIAIAEYATSMKRGADSTLSCAGCGEKFPRLSAYPRKKYCSPQCRYQAVACAPIGDKPCEHCGAVYQPSNTRQRFCSHPCRSDWLRAKKRKEATPNSCCVDCGAQLAHKRGGRCRPCWRASRARPRLEVTLEAA